MLTSRSLQQAAASGPMWSFQRKHSPWITLQFNCQKTILQRCYLLRQLEDNFLRLDRKVNLKFQSSVWLLNEEEAAAD